MKKFFVALCLVAFCTVSFVGCNPPKKGDAAPEATTTAADEAPADATPATPAEEAK